MNSFLEEKSPTYFIQEQVIVCVYIFYVDGQNWPLVIFYFSPAKQKTNLTLYLAAQIYDVLI